MAAGLHDDDAVLKDADITVTKNDKPYLPIPPAHLLVKQAKEKIDDTTL